VRSPDLSPLQLQIAMHLANGMKLHEIANMLDLSLSYINKNANTARRKTNTRTLAHLVSVVIASGQLEWQADRRIFNGASAQAVTP
jgi:DNA-binding CsgD family transcriptional regulator